MMTGSTAGSLPDLFQQGTLLLVQVAPTGSGPGGWPCRILGTVSPGGPALPAAPEIPPADDAPERITALLTAIGIPANLLGYGYLRTALALVLSDGSLRRGMTRTLYPRIAERHRATAPGVERAIRHAIAATWSRGGGEQYRQALGRIASCVGERPTNAEFIAQAAERLRLG